MGIGAQPDADLYGDQSSHTLGHVCNVAGPNLPNLTALGLGCIEFLNGVPPVAAPAASYGKMREISAGKDSTTGHWELAGLTLDTPFPTFPDGFPDALIQSFLSETGCGGVLGNRPDSGTAIIDALGEQHMETGWPIVYTSADSVFQVATHKEVWPLEMLYKACEVAREKVCVGDFGVGRVIARPFTGAPGAFERVSAERKDYSLLPEATPLQVWLQQADVKTISVGKIADLFGGLGFDEGYKTKSNAEGIERTLSCISSCAHDDRPAFIWTNLVDFDQEFGHRNDPDGFAGALEAFDIALPALMRALPEDGVLLITADHGNDPTTAGTDHSREYVPVLKYRPGKTGKPVGVRQTFADHAATVAAYFGVEGVAGEAF